MARLRHAVAAALALACVAAMPAKAVIIEGGDIDVSGANNTVDLYFFTVDAAGPIGIHVDPRDFGVPLTGLEDPILLLYSDDGSLDAADLVQSDDNSIGPSGLNPLISFNIAAGSYVAVVGLTGLGAGEFGPIQTGSPSNVPFDYEIAFDGAAANESNIDCILHGNLDGTFTKTVRANDTCQIVAAPEPTSALLFGAGLAGLFGLTRAARRSSSRRGR